MKNFQNEHLFCDCKIVDAFWNDVFGWILARFHINIPSNEFHKLLGFHAQHVNNQLVNLMLLSARFLIYAVNIRKQYLICSNTFAHSNQ